MKKETEVLWKATEVLWSVQRAVVLDVSKRFRMVDSENEEEYAIIKVGKTDDFDEFQFKEKANKKRRFLVLMCFNPGIYNHVFPGNTYHFEGKVGFGLGNTYFKILDGRDMLGYKIGSPEGVEFAIGNDSEIKGENYENKREKED